MKRNLAILLHYLMVLSAGAMFGVLIERLINGQ